MPTVIQRTLWCFDLFPQTICFLFRRMQHLLHHQDGCRLWKCDCGHGRVDGL